jgi:excisionase family DNA binding protein
MTVEHSDPLLSRKEAAAYLGVTLGTLEQWSSSKAYNLPVTKIGTKMCKYRRSVLDKFIQEGEKHHVNENAEALIKREGNDYET